MGGHKKAVLAGANADWLRERIKSGPFTLRKLTTELAARGIRTHQKTVWLFVHAEGLSFKKNRALSSCFFACCYAKPVSTFAQHALEHFQASLIPVRVKNRRSAKRNCDKTRR